MVCACHRVLAHYSEDERLINLFYSKGDVYRVSLWYMVPRATYRRRITFPCAESDDLCRRAAAHVEPAAEAGRGGHRRRTDTGKGECPHPT